jgi:tetratricopeptide (TPR) repeat protein
LLFTVAACVALATGCAREADDATRAIMLADKGRNEEAAALLEAHLRKQPSDVKARRLLVRVYGALGDLGKARAHADELSRTLGVASPIPWLELGFALELTHRYDEALAAYDEATRVAPQSAVGPRTGGLRAARWGEHELARPRLEEALRRDPRDAVGWHGLGVVCVALGDLDGATRAYTSGLVADPEALENHLGLATVALLRHDAAAALAQYEAILARRPRHADAMLGRAWALGELRRDDEAARALCDAAALGASPAIVRNQERALAARRAAVGAPPMPGCAARSDPAR